MKQIFIGLLIVISTFNLFAQRVKDIAYITGNTAEQIIGYGLVVGLSGTGDSHRSSFTIQSIASMMMRFGITVPENDLKTKNVAAVMVTATINSYLKPGSNFDVTVSSIGDATGLQGGTLLMTPLSSMQGAVYGFAQGPISVGGYNITTPTGNRLSRNHSLAGRVPRGGILKLELENDDIPSEEVVLYLREPDLTTATNIVTAINSKFGENTSSAADPAEITINVPADRQSNIISFLSEVENLPVETDFIAKVVLNEKTGTVVAGSNVKILPVSISHGGLNITVRSYPIISQPGAFSNGTTEIFNNIIPFASQDSTNVVAIQGASNVQEVAAALNSLKVTPKDIIAIFQALKEAGALIAELIII
ncbi:MAG: flagellar basal body P-ring protein FlgI [Ignavibacteriaceae bacterium]